VSCIEEIFDALLEDQERQLHRISDHDARIRLVSSVLSTFEVHRAVGLPCICLLLKSCVLIHISPILQSIIQEATQRRNVKYSLYHPSVVTSSVEFVPWTGLYCVI